MSQTNEVPVLIIGGGIGGLASALALSLQGRKVHVIERAATFGEIGAGLQLAPNALRCLDRLGVLDAVCVDAVFPTQLLMLDATSAEPITAVATGAKFRERYGYPYAVMHRSDLHAQLLRACEAASNVSLETSRAVVEIVDLETTAKAICADGSSYVAELLIGADGLHSKVRPMLGDDLPPVCQEYVAFRGTVPRQAVVEAAREDSMVGWVGPEMHLIQYPVRRGDLLNQVAVFRSPSFRPDSDDWGTFDELAGKLSGMHPMVRAALSTINRDRRWTMYDRPPLERWVRHRIVLAGDAAHPMLQYAAQGACQALEDAVCLAAMLDRSDDVDSGLTAYQAARIAHTARVQLTARFFGDIAHADGIAAMFRNAAFRSRAADDYTYLDWLYGYDPLEPNQAEDAQIYNWLQAREAGGVDTTRYPG